MMQVQNSYSDEYDAFDEDYSAEEYPDAKQRRDRRAKQLRKEGYLVQTETTDDSFNLSAEKRRTE